MTKKEIVEMLNKALELEHSAFVQYLSHAERVGGKNAEAIIARLKELAEDEKEHQEDFREMIGGYLDGVPSMGIAETYEANTVEEILKTNLNNEIEAVEYYQKIMEKIKEEKEDLPHEFLQLEHMLRHIIIDEQEHIVELKTLMS